MLLIQNILCDHRQHHIDDLYKRIKFKYSNFLSDNYITNSNQLFAVVAYLMKNDFNFSWPFFAEKCRSIDSEKQLIDSFMNDEEELTVDNLVLFAKEMGIVVPSILRLIKSLENIAILKNKNEFVLIEDIDIALSDISSVKVAIRKELLGKKCCAIRDLECIPNFPNIGIDWNEWLIYSVISKWIPDLSIDTTSNQFKHAIPIIALPGVNKSYYIDDIRKKYVGQAGNDLTLKADNLDKIDDLIADVLEDELIEIWEDV